jgi:hypothetical protein
MAVRHTLITTGRQTGVRKWGWAWAQSAPPMRTAAGGSGSPEASLRHHCGERPRWVEPGILRPLFNRKDSQRKFGAVDPFASSYSQMDLLPDVC